MTFTALHRAVGVPPGPLTDELLDNAVAAGAPEADDLDWKSVKLPPAKGAAQTDFPKDVAAMANSGGGIIVYGVEEDQKQAKGRVDAGDLDEGHERALRSAAITAISPPIFGLTVHRLPGAGKRAVIVEVPASVDVPHLVYRHDLFGAPVRNDADTVWMKERQIEAMYRARFDERRRATDALDTLFNEASAGRDTRSRAWLIAVAHPRISSVHHRLSRDDARAILREAERLTLNYSDRRGPHPLEFVDRSNPRPGLRRWIAARRHQDWREAWVTVHHDGSVTLAGAVGGRPIAAGQVADGSEVEPRHIEYAIADLMALLRATAEATENGEYDLRVGLSWASGKPLTMLPRDQFGLVYDDDSPPVTHYTPIETTLNAVAPDVDFAWSLYQLTLDCVNQCGVADPRVVSPPTDATSIGA